jgi:uncharacterized protein YxjI
MHISSSAYKYNVSATHFLSIALPSTHPYHFLRPPTSFSSHPALAMSPLAPLPSAVGLFSPFIALQPTTLDLAGHYFGAGSFDVTHHSTNTPVFKIKANLLSASHRHLFYDPQGTHICTLRRELWHAGHHYYLEAPNAGKENHLLDLQSGWNLDGQKSTVSFRNACDGRGEAVELALDFHRLRKHTEIIDSRTNMVVAGVDREMWTIKKEYHVDVAPGMDMVVAVAIVMVLADRLRTQAKKGEELAVG